VFENRVLRRIYGPRRDEVTEGWRKLQNEELYNLYCSANIIKAIKERRMKSAKHEKCVQNMNKKTEGKGALGRPRSTREDNIKTYLRKAGLEDVDWIHLAQYKDRWRALVNKVINLLVL
jgi:ribosome biogenesis protein Nip4